MLAGFLLGSRIRRSRRRGIQFLVMSALTGLELIPISSALSGALAQWKLEALFIVAGALLAVTSLLILTSRGARQID